MNDGVQRWTAAREAVHAEWTKARTLPGTLWSLLAVVAVTISLSALATAAVSCESAGCSQDTTKISLTGVLLGQALAAVLAVQMVSGEYSTDMMRSTLAAIPRRSTVLAAKAVVLTGMVAAAGVLSVLGSLLVGRLVLPAKGFTEAHGFAPLSLADGSTLRAVSGSVLYLVLIAVLSLGIATAVRDAATAVGLILGVLYLLPILALAASNPHLAHRLKQLSPSTAGLTIQATRDLASLPISPWPGMCVVAAWAGAALASGGLLLRLRDA